MSSSNSARKLNSDLNFDNPPADNDQPLLDQDQESKKKAEAAKIAEEEKIKKLNFALLELMETENTYIESIKEYSAIVNAAQDIDNDFNNDMQLLKDISTIKKAINVYSPLTQDKLADTDQFGEGITIESDQQKKQQKLNAIILSEDMDFYLQQQKMFVGVAFAAEPYFYNEGALRMDDHYARGRTQILTLQSQAMSTVQRLPRYILLFDAILKNTSANDPETLAQQKAAIKKAETAASLVNSIGTAPDAQARVYTALCAQILKLDPIYEIKALEEKFRELEKNKQPLNKKDLLRLFELRNSRSQKLEDIKNLQNELLNLLVPRQEKVIGALLDPHHENSLLHKDDLTQSERELRTAVTYMDENGVRHFRDNASLTELKKTTGFKAIAKEIINERYNRMTDGLRKIAADKRLDIDVPTKAYIDVYLSAAEQAKEYHPETKEPKAQHLIPHTNEIIDTNAFVDLAENEIKLKATKQKYDMILTAFRVENPGKYPSDMSVSEKFKRSLLETEMDILKKNIYYAKSKIDFITHLNAIALTVNAFKPNSILPTQYSENIKVYESRFATIRKEWQELSDTSLTNNQYHCQNFNADFNQMMKTLDNVKRNEADLIELHKVLADLRAHPHKNLRSNPLKNRLASKYLSYELLKRELRDKIASIEAEKQANLVSLAKQDADIIEHYQLALVAAEQKKTEDIMLASRWHERELKGIQWPTSFADNHDLQIFLREYKAYADNTDARIHGMGRLNKQKQTKIKAKDDTQSLWHDINKYSKANSVVTNAYKAYTKEHKAYSKTLNKTIARLPLEIEKLHNRLMKEFEAAWREQDDTNEDHLQAHQLIIQHVKNLRQVSEMAVAMHDSQAKLTSQAKNIGIELPQLIINKDAHEQLINFLNDNMGKLRNTRKPGVDPFRDALIIFMKSPTSRPVYKALPKAMRKKLKDLNRKIELNFEPKKSMLQRSLHGFLAIFEQPGTQTQSPVGKKVDRSSPQLISRSRHSVGSIDETPPPLDSMEGANATVKHKGKKSGGNSGVTHH